MSEDRWTPWTLATIVFAVAWLILGLIAILMLAEMLLGPAVSPP